MKDLRTDYQKHELDESSLLDDPIVQFKKWYDEATEAKMGQPNAMILSTRSEDGVDSRTVLLKAVENDAFTFFTNYNSYKGQQLEHFPGCSLLFLWLEMERQVKIRGLALKLSDKISDEYFRSRPRGSQISAWVSNQSEQIESREALERKHNEIEELYEGKEVPRPPYWGGFEVRPYSIEFWQGRENRLHDRIVYSMERRVWVIRRLQP